MQEFEILDIIVRVKIAHRHSGRRHNNPILKKKSSLYHISKTIDLKKNFFL